MYLLSRVKEVLDQQKIPYTHQVHRTAYTAQEVAAEEHIPGREMAKTVVLKTSRGLAMAVLPASQRLDLEAARGALGDPNARLASELEFTGMFPDCDVGAMPPFGNLYGIPVFVDAALAGNAEIVFNATTHQDTIRMSYGDFVRLVKPAVGSFSWTRAA